MAVDVGPSVTAGGVGAVEGFSFRLAPLVESDHVGPDLEDVGGLGPPYEWQEWHALWQYLPNVLKENTQVYIERKEKIQLPQYLTEIKNGKCGISHFVLAEHIQAA